MKLKMVEETALVLSVIMTLWSCVEPRDGEMLTAPAVQLMSRGSFHVLSHQTHFTFLYNRHL